MSIGNLLKRLILADEAEFTAPPAPLPKRPMRSVAAPAKTVSKAESGPVTLVRDPIIDAANRICGYRFCAKPVGESSPSSIVAALKSEAIKTLAERRMAIVPLAIDDWRTHDYRQFVAPHTVILLKAPQEAASLAHWLDVAREIKAGGARIALHSFDLSNAFADVLKLAELAFLDFSAQSLKNLEFLVQTLKQSYPSLKLAVENISTWPERRLCLAAGVPYCLGSFMATMDAEDGSPQLSQSRLVVIEMLNLLRKDADLSELSAIARRDPEIAMQIVGMANSPLLGLGNAVASVDQAIVLVGREWLYRSLSISIFRVGGKKDNGDAALLEMSLARARLMELVATASLPKKECEELFLVGLLSLLDRLLNLRMSAILAKIKLPVTVVDALLRGNGPHAPWLMLAMAVESGNAARARSLASGLGLTAEVLEAGSLVAMTWAQDALGS